MQGYSNVRAEFQVPNAITTIYLISSTAYYAAPSDDPIFPAVPGTGIWSNFGQVSWNDRQRHSILACANSITIRHPHTGAVWYPNLSDDAELEKPQWNEPSVADTVTLLNLSLTIPDHYMGHFSFQTNQFDINNREYILSGPIPYDYWKSEVQRLFKIQLARLQMDVVGVAQGLAHDLPGAENELAKRRLSEACKHIKFQDQEHTNLSVAGLVGFMSLNLLVWLCTIKLRNEIVVVWFINSCLKPGVGWFWSSLVLSFLILRYTVRKIQKKLLQWGHDLISVT